MLATNTIDLHDGHSGISPLLTRCNIAAAVSSFVFATLLNWQFLERNPDKDGVDVSNAVQRIEL